MAEMELNKDDSAAIFVHLPALQKTAQYSDINGWRESLIEYEQNWSHPVEEKLRQKKIRQINIHTDDRVFQLTPFCLESSGKEKKVFLILFINPDVIHENRSTSHNQE